jgi:ABC-2 type transport system ATP-binding protein
VISATGLGRSFDGRPAVDSLTFEIPNGSLLALLGPNGAGKTTTVRMLLGLIRPTTGSARIAGIDLAEGDAARQRLRSQCGFLTEAPGFYERRNALENLRFFAKLYAMGSERESRIESSLREFDLWDHRNQPVGTFSKGMKQRLAIIRALFHEPQVLFLDEPTAGLDPEAALEVREVIARLKNQGRTILVCTHNLAEAERLADWVGIINCRLLAFGTLANLQRGTDIGTRVQIRLASAAEPWRILVAQLDGVSDVEVMERRLEFQVRDAEAVVPRAVAALAAASAPIVEVMLHRPTLEAVYLSSIRDGTE